MAKKINDNFLIELLKLCLRNRNVIDCCINHLEFHYIELESYKTLWKDIKTFYLTQGKFPTIGIISQGYNGGTKLDKEVLALLLKIREAEIAPEDIILTQLEEYIKDAITIEVYDKFADIYNKGKKEEGRALLREVSEKLANFNIKKDTDYFEPIFGGFKSRQERKKLSSSQNENPLKVVWGVDEIDNYINGGINPGDIAMFLAQSGVGKTTWLRWIGVSNARRGLRVLHIQLEGSKEECEDGYDQTWTAQSLMNLEYGNIEPKIFDDLIKTSEQLTANGGEIWVESYEEFDSFSCKDLKNRILDFIKIHGFCPELILLDYFELLEPGDGKKYLVNQERQRREAIGKKLKNIANQFKNVIIAPTQASTVSPEELNNPDFVQTRYHISEFKGALQPFSYFFTCNQTSDEYEAGVMRIFADKIRKYKKGWIVKILQAYSHGKFYDRKRTMKEYHNVDI